MRKARIISSKPPPVVIQAAPEGFAAGLRAVIERKYRELTGRRWVGASERAKRAEAARRGRTEMAKRIERQTGKRLSEVTIGRYAGRDSAPKGVDGDQLNRQAAIDRAGGLKPFAGRAGVGQAVARRWRDRGGALAPTGRGPSGPMVLMVDVHGFVVAKGRRYPRHLQLAITFSGPVADMFRAAQSTGDTQTMAGLIGPQVAAEYLAVSADFEVSEIVSVSEQ
jgi:hypothetical protein